MTNTILEIIDEKLTGEVVNKMTIPVKTPTLSIKEIITIRVVTEVKKYNSRSNKVFYGLVRPTEAEEILNEYKTKVKKRKTIDAEKQTFIALSAFQENRYFIFVNNKQVESLEEQVEILHDTKVKFIKLTPLIGG